MQENNNDSDWKIPLYKIYSDDDDLNIITKIIKRGNRWAIGPEIDEFECALKKYTGSDYCLTLNSGTSALHALFLAYGISSSDNVILPSFSFISTANCVVSVGGQLNFAEIEDTTYGLDPNSIKNKINKNTKAIVPIDYAGLSCDISSIKQIAEENKAVLIEDAAESLGSTVKGKKVGTISDAAIFSFCGNKVLTTGEGGAMITNSKEIYEKIKLIRSHGRIDQKNYFENPNASKYFDIGYNWRMSSITAALGISQLEKLDKLISMRQQNASFITSHLSKHPELILPYSSTDSEHIFQMYTVRLPSQEIRNKLHNFLTSKRIFSKIYFHPIHLTDFYSKSYGYSIGDLPITEKISNEVLTLPLYPNMTQEEKLFLTESIDEFFEL